MSSKTAIRELPDFLATRIDDSELLRQPIDQFRYSKGLSDAFSGNKSASLNGNAMAALYKADIHYPYQVASLQVSRRQSGGHMHKVLVLENYEYVYVAWLDPLQKAMAKEHVHFGEWEAYQDILLQSKPDDFSPQRQWMRENFPGLEDLHAEFLESRYGREALADYRQAFVAFAEENGVDLEPPSEEHQFGRGRHIDD